MTDWVARGKELSEGKYRGVVPPPTTDGFGADGARRAGIGDPHPAGIGDPHPDEPGPAEPPDDQPDDPKPEPVRPVPLGELHERCRYWFGEHYDLDAIDAALAAVAVERLDGDLLWLLIVRRVWRDQDRDCHAVARLRRLGRVHVQVRRGITVGHAPQGAR